MQGSCVARAIGMVRNPHAGELYVFQGLTGGCSPKSSGMAALKRRFAPNRSCAAGFLWPSAQDGTVSLSCSWLLACSTVSTGGTSSELVSDQRRMVTFKTKKSQSLGLRQAYRDGSIPSMAAITAALPDDIDAHKALVSLLEAET